MKTKKKFLTVIGLAAISAVSVFAAGCSGTSWIDQIFCDHETTEIVAAVEPTCTEAGYTEYERCVDCGKEVTEGKEIAAEGHTLKTIAGYDATCTKMGLSDGKECTVCEETVETQKNIPAKGHTLETVKGKAATCTETGLTDGQACKDCGKVYVAQEEIAAKGHDIVGGTCTVCAEIIYVYDDETKYSMRLMEQGEKLANKWVRLYGGASLIIEPDTFGYGFKYGLNGLCYTDGPDDRYICENFPLYVVGEDYIDIYFACGDYVFEALYDSDEHPFTITNDTVFYVMDEICDNEVENDGYCYVLNAN